MKNIKLVYSSSIAATLTIITITIVTILGELLPAFKDFLKSFTGHHWLTKSVLSLLVYFGGVTLFYLIPKNIGSNTLRRALIFLILTVMAGFLVILLFFIWHFIYMV
ncbi:MAG: hypothetical protein HYX20_00180 [Candidatus Yanofskybacteria bacterium]|nr:hypothetical protein [Candidatus Yanofskybacteria bacterium]